MSRTAGKRARSEGDLSPDRSSPRACASPRDCVESRFEECLVENGAVIHLEAAMRGKTADTVAAGGDPVAKDRNDRPAVLMQDGLHFPDVRLALGLVGFAFGVREQPLEFVILP